MDIILCVCVCVFSARMAGDNENWKYIDGPLHQTIVSDITDVEIFRWRCALIVTAKARLWTFYISFLCDFDGIQTVSFLSSSHPNNNERTHFFSGPLKFEYILRPQYKDMA